MTAGQRAAALPVAFFARPAEQVAPDLLGKLLVSRAGGRPTVGRIVETEAYLGHDDPASHGFRHRRHAQNLALYGPPATWYVYRSYGIHWCLNAVCLSPGTAAAVLIRAVEPLEGLSTMRRRRSQEREAILCAGPGRLCQAMGVTRAIDGSSLRRPPIWIATDGAIPPGIQVTPRIGISKAADWPLRFVVSASPWASRGPRGFRPHK